jgi:hypothetical protein
MCNGYWETCNCENCNRAKELYNDIECYWDNKENGIKATKWLIEEKLKLNDEELKEQLSVKLFIENGVGGMLQHCFNYSPYEAINTTYPNRFKKSDFKNYN